MRRKMKDRNQCVQEIKFQLISAVSNIFEHKLLGIGCAVFAFGFRHPCGCEAIVCVLLPRTFQLKNKHEIRFQSRVTESESELMRGKVTGGSGIPPLTLGLKRPFYPPPSVVLVTHIRYTNRRATFYPSLINTQLFASFLSPNSISLFST